jgi:hypothetical protein
MWELEILRRTGGAEFYIRHKSSLIISDVGREKDKIENVDKIPKPRMQFELKVVRHNEGRDNSFSFGKI